MLHEELEYCVKRARQEAHRALASKRPEVAAAHRGLAIRYSARARILRQEQFHHRTQPETV